MERINFMIGYLCQLCRVFY